MLKLLKATAIVSIATIATIITGLIRAKFTAVTLGPAGVGIFSQAFNFQQLAINIASLNIGLGIAKHVAQHNAQNDQLKIKGVISSASIMQIIASVAFIILTFIFAGRLSKFLFSSSEYKNLLIILSFGVLFFVLGGAIEAALLGFGNYKAFAKGRSLSSILSLIPLFIFIAAMGVKGGFIYLALNGVITFLVYYYLFYKNVPKDIFNSVFVMDKSALSKENLVQSGRGLLSYGGVMFVTGVLSMGSIVLLRSLLIKYYGADASGYYQVVFSLSAYHIAFFTNGLWSYSYAKLSIIQDRNDYSFEVNSTLRFCTFGVVPMIAVIFFAKDMIIKLVFSGKFIYSRELFSTQLFGDVFFLLFYVMGVSLLASARLRAYLGLGIFSSISFIALFLSLHNILGLKAVTTAYFIANLLSFSAVVYYHIRWMGLKITMQNVKLLVSAAGLCVIILFFGKDGFFMVGLKTALLAAWLYFLSTSAEKSRLFDIILKKFRFGGNTR